MSIDAETLIGGALVMFGVPLTIGFFPQAIVLAAVVGGFVLFGYLALIGIGLILGLVFPKMGPWSENWLHRLIRGRLNRARHQ